ncbi:MAG: DUF2079 domain-containing protein [Actinomycetota bacterium]|nr:DUF2079 domain-containing protein [Actinomycetota bacterium]
MLAVQAIVLLVASVAEYRSGEASADFAHFNQAWYLIAHGHLNPHSTFYASGFVNQHGELIMWLIAPLYWLNRNQGLTLLVIQALAIVASIGTAASWLLAVARRHHLPSPFTSLSVGVLLCLCALNPWIYTVVYEDFHFEVLAVFFALAAGRDLYTGHRRRAALWVLLGLMTGDVAASYIAAVGVGLLVTTKGSRRDGAVMAVTGVVWFALLIGFGANVGSPVSGYHYLAVRSNSSTGFGGAIAIVEGIVVHPRRPIHQLNMVSNAVWENLAPAGTVGLVDPLMILPVLTVLLANALNSAGFINVRFQNFALFVFCSLGTALICVRLAGHRGWRRAVTVIVVVSTVLTAVAFDIPRLRSIPEITFRVSPTVSRQLAAVRALIPESAEVVSSFGVVGRLSGRPYAYAILHANFVVPVQAREIIFVFAPTAGNVAVPPAVTSAANRFVAANLKSKEIYAGADITAYVWYPSKAGGTVVLP